MPGRKHRVPLRVVAWGTSVLASALVAGLAPRTDLDVEQIEATLPAALAALQRKRAHAVVCDQASVPAATVLTLLALHPHLVIVIIDPNADQALTLRSRRHPMRTIDDLVTALSDGARGRDGQAPTHIEVPT
jgi:hypothetical protein